MKSRLLLFVGRMFIFLAQYTVMTRNLTKPNFEIFLKTNPLPLNYYVKYISHNHYLLK